MSDPAARRARHLIDPDRPRQRATSEDLARLERVQRTVMSVLAVTTIGHLAVGLVLAALYVVDADRTDAQVGLCLMAGLTGIVAVAVGLAVHRRPLLSPWLAAGLLPAAVGLALVLG